MRGLVVVTVVLVLSACRHSTEIVGRGDIVSLTGTRDCAYESQPCEFLVAGDYTETYTAVPRPGWKFVGWEQCAGQFPTCSFNVSSEIVERFEGQAFPPVVAVFEPLGEAKPNILAIMVDDLGFNDLAINNGNTAIHTPNMDQLARDGVRFTRHYASPVCSPARASYLTGMVPERLGFLPNKGGISLQLTTLPERLQQEGYTTWHVGKWHVGDAYAPARPDRQGFDRWFGFLNQWRLAGEFVDGKLQLVRPRYEDPWLEGDQDPGQHYPGHLENILTDKAEQVIAELQSAGEPWYLNLWYFAPHDPVSPAPEFASGYPDTEDGRYRALVHQLDHNIGRLVSHLESLDALEDTIIVVVSDNGGARDHLENNENNAPFAGFKSQLLEGSLRTPLIVRWPQRSLAGTVHDAVVSIEDIYPSLLEAIDVAPVTGIDGRSFLSAIQGSAAGPRPLFWELVGNYNDFSALSADHRWKAHQPAPLWGVQFPFELYDMELEPTGTHPLDPPPAATLAQLYDDYVQWYRQVHVVATQYAPTVNGAGTLTGSDFQRTPSLGFFTFGVGIAHDFQGRIAAQGSAWQIDLTGASIEARFGDILLHGEVPAGPDCHSIVVSGQLERRVSSFSINRTRLSLFIDGLEASSVDTGMLVPAQFNQPTAIGDETIEANGAIYLPVILNRSLVDDTVWPVADFSAELCPGA